ncbi:crotonobetainyl-CoA--carnitine CoA-transferase [Vicingus serpentipes]|uniref:Crotonobetainyl-CoA--carnitine CoA-transferase n=1 Tax=Vicingus serpentipes TaxID=1926625 RepID=A0A5C6RYN1_9FLAO|nr:crotonobetainyl-CoA--carnitine CoA-transferase [Vicingus serpentipes]TXB67263.1 crotonobetainyl-CoA--carnitine CoA-transferase [Vicingus serpentipes]
MNTVIKSIASEKEKDNRGQLKELFDKNPIFEDEKINNVALYLKRQELSKVLFLNEIYSHIKDVHGVIMEFGVRWGQNLTTLNNLRGIYEPFNHSRKIIGFDTFEGFAGVGNEDGAHDYNKTGAFNVSKNYEEYLANILNCHENECPLNHINKNLLIKGEATKTLAQYLKDHQETIIAFAYFDFDIYKPTVECLKLIEPYLTKGSILGFDELCDPGFPGETQALREVFGTNNFEIKRNRFSGIQSYLIFK